MPVNLKCSCGCKIEFKDENDGLSCNCGLNKLQIQTVDNKKVATIVPA